MSNLTKDAFRRDGVPVVIDLADSTYISTNDLSGSTFRVPFIEGALRSLFLVATADGQTFNACWYAMPKHEGAVYRGPFNPYMHPPQRFDAIPPQPGDRRMLIHIECDPELVLDLIRRRGDTPVPPQLLARLAKEPQPRALPVSLPEATAEPVPAEHPWGEALPIPTAPARIGASNLPMDSHPPRYGAYGLPMEPTTGMQSSSGMAFTPEKFRSAGETPEDFARRRRR